MLKTTNNATPVHEALATRFVQGLLRWNQAKNKRQMPWKGEKDPYKIWISEIILQQTRVEQGWHYYTRFIEAFPTVQHLAHSPDQDVYKLWEGLGYYSRCKNLLATARFIAKERDGIFPRTYNEILALKGVGPYTAAAIASFAYNLPYAVVDGNVFRVLSRIFEIDTAIDTTEGKKFFSSLAQQLLPRKKGAEYNQAIMDFGALICKPYPACHVCFFKKNCLSFLHNKQELLPVKAKEKKVKERWFAYVVLKQGNRYAIRQRLAKDIWQYLYDFILMETAGEVSLKKLLPQFSAAYNITPSDFTLSRPVRQVTQQLSHRRVHFTFIQLELTEPVQLEGFIWASGNELKQYPFPKTLQQYIAEELN